MFTLRQNKKADHIRLEYSPDGIELNNLTYHLICTHIYNTFAPKYDVSFTIEGSIKDYESGKYGIEVQVQQRQNAPKNSMLTWYRRSILLYPSCIWINDASSQINYDQLDFDKLTALLELE